MNLYNPKVMEFKAENKIATPENLVFSGGGIKGLAYVGVIKALDEKNLFKNVKRFAGASAGAITAALLAIGMSPDELDEQMTKVDFSTFLKKSEVNIEELVDKPSRIIDPLVGLPLIVEEARHLGLCDCSVFLEWLASMFKLKGFDENTTFAQLYDAGNREKELRIALCCANYGKTVIASYNDEETADMPVISAVRASMSIPLVFQPFKWKGNTYVDGGTMYNYPIEVFDKESSPDKTLGFILSTKDNIYTPPRKEDDSITAHIGCIIEAIMNVSYEYCFRLENHNRTIFINPAKIGALDFNLTEDQKKLLKDNGYNAAMDYFK